MAHVQYGYTRIMFTENRIVHTNIHIYTHTCVCMYVCYVYVVLKVW